MELLKDNSTKSHAENETQSLIHEFLDRIEKAKKTNLNEPNIQDIVSDCIYLLLRLGYDAQRLYQLSNLSEKFLRTNFHQMELQEPPQLLKKLSDNSYLPNSIPTERPYKSPGAPSKIKSFLETVHSVKEQSQKNKLQNVVTPTITTVPSQSNLVSKQRENEFHIQNIPNEQNWLSKSKISLTDSESDNDNASIPVMSTIVSPVQQETSKTPTIPTQAIETGNDSNTIKKVSLTNTDKNLSSSTNVTKLVSLLAYNNEEKKFQKVIKGRLTKLSSISFVKKNSSLHIEEIRQKLLGDVNKFMDYVELLRNKEKNSLNRTHATKNEDNSRNKLSVSSEQDSPQQEVLISDSFIKMTKVCFNFILFSYFKFYCVY